MELRKYVAVLFSVLVFFLFFVPYSMAERSFEQMRKDASRLYQEGNYKDALKIYKSLALNSQNIAERVGMDFNQAVVCMIYLNLEHETDDFREKVVMAHKDNWLVLFNVAQSWFNANHYGYLVSGEFQRGRHRSGGAYVNSYERDRIQALQLMLRAMENSRKETDKHQLSAFYFEFAMMMMGHRGHSGSWRLQYLSDLTTLPDYEEGYHNGRTNSGTPVDDAGNPVFYHTPETFQVAVNDGERWRFFLEQAVVFNPGQKRRSEMQLADFLHQQFGVQTLGYYEDFFSSDIMAEKRDSLFQLHTLKENETLAKLANGIQRLTLPDEFNFIGIYKQVAADMAGGYAEIALNKMATIYENRRQYIKAASCWEQSIRKFGNREDKQKKIDRIIGNWGRFEPVKTYPQGQAAEIPFVYRNGKQVMLEAREIHVEELIEGIKAYLASNPGKLDRGRINIGNIGYMLVQNSSKKYIGNTVARWQQKLDPGKDHFDRRVTIKTPLKKAGAYFVTAKIADGNISRIIVWINDTVIVKKQLDQQTWFYVADAVTGKPLPNVSLNFFGYRQERTDWEKVGGRHYNMLTQTFSKQTDKNGQVIPDTALLDAQYQWLITAMTGDGRLAFLGFSSVWYQRFYDRAYEKEKTFVMTDRPVYRPNQPMKFKIWVGQAKYDQPDTSVFANTQFMVRIFNPKNEKVFEEHLKTDAFGGLDGVYLLPDDCALGVYKIEIPGHTGNTFRVEEYKKPEFEVKIDTPDTPVMLGEKITANIQADYYFGAKVTHARVSYKVLRTSYTGRWYPQGEWDWLYGRGYWWFAYDYDWYPGWERWGCLRPNPFWWPSSHDAPEIVSERDADIGEDGKLAVTIDTALAKEIHGDQDHEYEIVAEVTDMSRRTMVGKGRILATREPFKVYAWVDRGHYQTGDTVHARFSAQTLDAKPVKGEGDVTLFKVVWKEGKPDEVKVYSQALNTDDQGGADLQMTANESGQYRLLYQLTDINGHTIEGGYVFNVSGKKQDKGFKFNEIELIPDKREYAPQDIMRLMINTDAEDSTVVLFLRPVDGVCGKPEIVSLKGQQMIKKIEIMQKDMPNFFVEAFTIRNGRVYSDIREIMVPPEKRVLNVDVTPSKMIYEPGEKAVVEVRLTDVFDAPYSGAIVMSVYDRAVEYISGGSNVPDIKAFFWKWRNRHHKVMDTNAERLFRNIVLEKEAVMQNIGIFGHVMARGGSEAKGVLQTFDKFGEGLKKEKGTREMLGAPAPPMEADAVMDSESMENNVGPQEVIPMIRKSFADTAFWTAALTSDKEGIARVAFPMPENLTGWKIRVWALGHGTKVGEGMSDVVTSKKLLLRLQAPRFFVEKDEVTLSANIHNYLEEDKHVRALLELEGKALTTIGDTSRKIIVPSEGENRVDFRVKAEKEGNAVIRMKALSDQVSDAMEMQFPVYVHGMLKTESYCGSVPKDKGRSVFEINVPIERRIDESRFEIRYSPTLAGAMVDALPYLANYPYGCTEQTLNRFLPTVITLNVINRMGIDLLDLKRKITNLNTQEIGNPDKRAEQWRQWKDNPVFDKDIVLDMARKGLARLANMQVSDGGWGWFSGWGERSYPHTTAYVVHGLQIAEKNNMAVPKDMLERGINWLSRYQAQELVKLKNSIKKNKPYKISPDNLDVFVYMVLTDSGRQNRDMRSFLYDHRNSLSVYGKAMLGMALYQENEKELLSMVLKNIEQYVVRDSENQTAWLNLPNEGYWWHWYGSEFEAHAYYLKLLSCVAPKSDIASGLVKYLLNNRKNDGYWHSTRDTALCIEAMADYLKASEEDKPDLKVEILMDGVKHKQVNINTSNLFVFDNSLVLSGKELTAGRHEIEILKKGIGPLYYNAYMTNFTLEDQIKKTGLEIRINRKYYKLEKIDKKIKTKGQHGQALDQAVEKYQRIPITGLGAIKSSDLVEIELEITSKNDYEYIVIEDMKAAGCEPFEVRSGYNGNALSAYMELRDERICLFVPYLARGTHSVSYRMRAEIPGRFSALPAKAFAMYAPELKANSDEIKLNIEE